MQKDTWGSQEASMMNLTRAGLLDTASIKLVEVVLLLMEEGERLSGLRGRGTRAAGGGQCADFSSCHLHALSGGAGAKVARYVDPAVGSDGAIAAVMATPPNGE